MEMQERTTQRLGELEVHGVSGESLNETLPRLVQPEAEKLPELTELWCAVDQSVLVYCWIRMDHMQ